MSNPEQQEHHSRVSRNRYRANNLATTEAWLAAMGVKLIDAWVYHPLTGWHSARQVDDHDTFLECVDDAMRRKGARYALWHDGEQWCLLSKRTGDTRRCPSREAAEMLAIHGA